MKDLLRKNKYWIISAILFFIGLVAGWQIGAYKENVAALDRFSPVRSPADYGFINPLIGFDISQNQVFPELNPIKTRISSVIDQAIQNKKIERVGFYFRFLDSGHWFGLNENEKFHPGSLLKLPIMIAYFKEAENQKTLLSQSLYFSGRNTTANPPLTAEASTLKPGQYYTTENLIKNMIIKSDNDAKDILLDNINMQYFKEVFGDFGEIFPNVDDYTISPKAYASFFRRLYNATYLNRDFSEEALKLLSQAEFKSGLKANIPDNVAVAHKFGERGIYGADGNLIGVELHDCGIVYTPQKPYLICAMTAGNNTPNSETVIQEISEAVYKTMSQE